MIVRDKLYINGEWVPSTGTDTIDVYNSATEEVMGTVPQGTAEDVDKAVAAAKAAFESWSQTSVDERTDYLQRLADAINAHGDEFADLIADELGMPLTFCRMIQVGMPAAIVASYVQHAKSFQWEREVGNSIVVKEPIGVVGCITPWNFPIHQITNKISPALAAGCTVVVKPSENSPLTAYKLTELIEEIGLPKGVFNLVSGYGVPVGERIASHPDVDMVSFTGSTRAGKRVGELAAQTVKRVALELGGKSANVILEDADFASAIPDGVQQCYINSGQTCSALTRMLVPKSRYEEAVGMAKMVAENFAVGDPKGEGSILGPLITKAQRDRVRGYIQKGLEEGARLVTGGAEQPEGLEKGYYIKPTVFADVRNDMTIAQEEIFGPVLSIIPYEDEEDAIRIANDSPYGLGGGVWAADTEHAKKVARRIRTGQVSVNGGNFNVLAPFGGYKQSGCGREMGVEGLEEYLETKAMQL